MIVPKHAIVTFASQDYRHTQPRFERQAREIDVFDEFFIWTEEDLDPGFVHDFSFLLSREIRGFGYWVWKPQVILQALEELEDGDVLVYLDSGSHINPGGRQRLLKYFEIARAHPTGILAFQMSHPEKRWTKSALCDFFEVSEHTQILESGQVQGGAIVIVKSALGIELVQRWLNIFRTHPNLVDDSVSRGGEARDFIAHRHDQSVFSILAKKEGIALLSASEQFPEPPLSWSELEMFPFHHRRDTVKPTIRRFLKQKWKSVTLPFEVFLVKSKRSFLALLKARAR